MGAGSGGDAQHWRVPPTPGRQKHACPGQRGRAAPGAAGEEGAVALLPRGRRWRRDRMAPVQSSPVPGVSCRAGGRAASGDVGGGRVQPLGSCGVVKILHSGAAAGPSRGGGVGSGLSALFLLAGPVWKVTWDGSRPPACPSAVGYYQIRCRKQVIVLSKKLWLYFFSFFFFLFNC